MIASERKLRILRMLAADSVINLKDVARALDTSDTTIRRDFEQLEKEEKLTRVQGGAMRKSGVEEQHWDAPFPPQQESRLAHRAEKRAVAQAAAAVVKDGDSVFIDSGSSLVPLGEILLRRRVQIVTNNTLLLGRGNGTAQVVLAGGTYKAAQNLTCGPIAKAAVNQFRLDHAFLGCCGFSPSQQKAYTLEIDAVEVKRAGMHAAAACYLLCDHAKYERNGFYSFAALPEFACIFCDALPGGAVVPENFRLLKNEKM